MSEIINRAKAALAANILWIFFFSTNALAISYMGATFHMDFFSLPPNEKFNTCVSMYANWSLVMMALMVTVGKRIKKGEDLLDDDKDIPTPVINQNATIK